MKRFLFTTIVLVSIAAIWSCSSDDDSDGGLVFGGKQPDVVGHLLDGGSIRSISLYCIDKRDSCYNEPYYTYYNKVKTLDNFSQMDLYIMINWYGSGNQGNPDSLCAIQKIEQEYAKERTVFLQKAYRQYQSYAKNGWPYFLTAYVNGEVTLTCDKDLYGEKAGTNLSKYFGIFGRSYCIPQGIDNPSMRYNFCDVQPNIMKDYFIDQSWLQADYPRIDPLYNPTEKYDELVFTLTIPMTVDYIWDYASAKYRGLNEELKRENKVFTSKCTVKFTK